MLNRALYKLEMRRSVRLLAILVAVMLMYIAVIISMYDPAMMAMLDSFVVAMPELMAAVGMRAGANSLLGFMVSYLYGFILLVFPMVYCILRGNGLMARYIDNGSLVTLVAAPVKRRTVALTQTAVLISGILLLALCTTLAEWLCAAIIFPGELDLRGLLTLNGGLVCLHLFIGGVCFLASCASPDTRRSISIGAGVPALMYVLQMLANVGGAAEKAKYVTFFTLYDPYGLLAGRSAAVAGVLALLAGAVALYAVSMVVFCRRDLPV